MLYLIIMLKLFSKIKEEKIKKEKNNTYLFFYKLSIDKLLVLIV